MRQDVRNFVNSLDRKNFTNNNQRVLYNLLVSLEGGDGGWVSLNKFRVNFAGSRVRDLRKAKYGGFDVQCRSASRLERRGGQHTFYYKLNQRNLSVSKLRKVF
jgi:hypothetical protein